MIVRLFMKEQLEGILLQTEVTEVTEVTVLMEVLVYVCKQLLALNVFLPRTPDYISVHF
jgi:hypothetical protein